MTTQIMFKIEDKLKRAAQKRAREEGITLSDFYKSATKSFIEGKMTIGMIFEEESLTGYTNQSIKDLQIGLDDIKKSRFFRAK